ncbi:MAG: leucyl aminopeptidase [Nitrospiraceae bacterium]|nr:leucyl aminopeptidase [Nitrospiraceae bacterium]
MKIAVRDAKEADFSCDALILPVFEDEGLAPYKEIDKRLDNLPSKLMSSGELRGRQAEVFLLHTYGKIKPERILFAGLGKKSEASRERARRTGGKAASYLRELKGIKDIALSTANFSTLMPDDFVEGALLSQYRFGTYKKEENEKGLKNLTILSGGLSGGDWKERIKWLEEVEAGTSFARDLVNTPANDLTPSALAEAALSLKKVKVKVIEKKEAEKLGMGAFLSVARGSHEPPKFIVLTYENAKATKTKTKTSPVALVGKSITFDSGGISIKPSDGMEKMKYDMAGGAAVLGAIKAASELDMPVNVLGILPAAENLPGGSASKPGDIVRTITGKTVEIINTDAEGRLALADAIGYAAKSNPKAIIDVATLTGACSIALGNEAIAMMGNNEELIGAIKEASEDTNERVWRMPLYDEYKEYIESDVADLKNSGGRSGSLVTAGYFLKEFAGDTPWVHLDIASTAWADKDKPYIHKGATGMGVRLLLSFLKNMKA